MICAALFADNNSHQNISVKRVFSCSSEGFCLFHQSGTSAVHWELVQELSASAPLPAEHFSAQRSLVGPPARM